jgi:hypothetical protein
MSVVAEDFGRRRSSPDSLSRSGSFFVAGIAQQVQTGVIVDFAPHWSDPEKLSFWRYDAAASTAVVIQRVGAGRASQMFQRL